MLRAIFLLFFVLKVIAITSSKHQPERVEDNEPKTCGKFDICNIVHSHYWGDESVEIFCKCPGDTACGATFSKTDPNSLAISHRSQMKFCSPTSELKSEMDVCESNETAIQVTTSYHIDHKKNIEHIKHLKATLLCYCETEEPNYWRHHFRAGGNSNNEVLDNFKCSELSECTENKFCGFTRLDYGFLFQRCTCDTAHECRYLVESSEIEADVESELFYSGFVYKSHCVRKDEDY